MELPFSQACENNKGPILALLHQYLGDRRHVFEVGAGTGQHAAYFAEQLPHLIWQCADRGPYLEGLNARIALTDLPNLPAAIAFDMAAPQWPAGHDAVYTANTLHIMSEALALELLRQAGRSLPPGGLALVYGPFKYRGQFFGPINGAFDARLRVENHASGIRDQEDVVQAAGEGGLELIEDCALPANNQLLVFRKTG